MGKTWRSVTCLKEHPTDPVSSDFVLISPLSRPRQNATITHGPSPSQNLAPHAAPPLRQRSGRGRHYRPHPLGNRFGAVPAGGPVHLHLGTEIAGLYRLPAADLLPARPHQADGHGRRIDRAARRV